jgi:hypothetical protein
MSSVPHPVRVLREEDGAPRISATPDQETYRWRPPDLLAAALLFLATAAFVLWQNSRVAVLWDLGYLLDSSWRIALGQVPYRDFPFAHAPLTFLIQSGLIRLGGRHYFLPVAYTALAGGLASVLTWRILVRTIRGAALSGCTRWLLALAMAAPLPVLGIYSVYPHPIYDCDCTLALLVALLLLARLQFPETGIHLMAPLAAGAATVLPLFFKQNVGLAFLSVVAAGMLVLMAAGPLPTRSPRAILESQAALVLAGMTAGLLAGVAIISATAGLGNYVHWTIQFAAQRRLPGVASMLSVYAQPSLAWKVPALAAGLILCYTRLIQRGWARVTAFCLIAAPFAGSLIFPLIDSDMEDRADNLFALWPLLLLAALILALFELRRGITLRRFMPFFVLAAIHSAFMSQQLWGSTYAIWPLLIVLAAGVLATLPAQARPITAGAGIVISLTFLICGGLYAASLDRLLYIRIPDGPVERSAIPALRGIATPGPFLPNFDELVRFAAGQIPPGDALLLLPGEDPFYYATGRTPRFPVTLFDPATDPYSATGLMDEARRRDVRWVIVKRGLQIDENPMPGREQTIELVQRDFALFRRLQGYDVYRRR